MIRPYYQQKPGPDDSGSCGSGFRFGSRLTPAVRWIIFACILVYLVEMVLGGPNSNAGRRLVSIFGFSPILAVRHMMVWQFVTYMFFHDGFWHIALNLLSLWMIGGLVEEQLGRRKFMWLFFLSGIGGAAAQMVLAVFRPEFDIATVGASAGIMGAIAAVAVLCPDMTILAFFILPMRMKTFALLLVGLQLLGAVSSAQGEVGGVAYFAHLGGLAVGYVYAKHQKRAGWWLNTLYYRLRGRFRGFVGPEVTHIDDDEKYREEVDRLLDKIFREGGTGALTNEEKEFLKRQSGKYKKQE